VSSSADIKELKQLLAADTGIEENDILLTEIDGEGFHRTFTGMCVTLLTQKCSTFSFELNELLIFKLRCDSDSNIFVLCRNSTRIRSS